MTPIPHALFLSDQMLILAVECAFLVLTFLYQRRAALFAAEARTWAFAAHRDAEATGRNLHQLQADALFEMMREARAEANQARLYAAQTQERALATGARARAEELEALAERLKQRWRLASQQLAMPASSGDASPDEPSPPWPEPPE